MGMESFGDQSSEKELEIATSPMEGFTDFHMDSYWAEVERIDSRIQALQNGEATKNGLPYDKIDAINEVTRLSNLKDQMKEAAVKGMISAELLKQRYSY